MTVKVKYVSFGIVYSPHLLTAVALVCEVLCSMDHVTAKKTR